METNYKSILLGVIAVAAVAALVLWGRGGKMETPLSVVSNYKDATYVIENREIKLTGGKSEIEVAPDSASKIVTQYFGNEAKGDLNGDGTKDVVFLLTQQGGGSGTFYYVAAALKEGEGYKGTNALLIGDRVAPQTTEIRGNQIIVNYAGPAPGAPMTAALDVGVTKYYKIEGGALLEGKVDESATGTQTPKVVTMQGIIVCLPHTDTSGPQTMECAYGLKDENGVYYGIIDADPSYANVTSAPMNVRVLVEGTLIPISGDNYYQSVANIRVTKITKI
mgnify:CR=1 FL=1